MTRNRRHVFSMPPVEQSAPATVEGMIMVDAETYRHQRKQLEEIKMKVSELFGRVDVLISLATNYKQAAASQPAPQPGSPPSADDPEVEALAHRIDDAIAVLQGTATTSPVTGATGGVSAAGDPNAPVV